MTGAMTQCFLGKVFPYGKMCVISFSHGKCSLTGGCMWSGPRFSVFHGSVSLQEDVCVTVAMIECSPWKVFPY